MAKNKIIIKIMKQLTFTVASLLLFSLNFIVNDDSSNRSDNVGMPYVQRESTRIESSLRQYEIAKLDSIKYSQMISLDEMAMELDTLINEVKYLNKAMIILNDYEALNGTSRPATVEEDTLLREITAICDKMQK